MLVPWFISISYFTDLRFAYLRNFNRETPKERDPFGDLGVESA
jgi:hypothetical protein